MRRRELLNHKPCEMNINCYEPSAAAQIITVGKEKVLEIDFAFKGKIARYFASATEKQWAVRINGEWKTIKANNIVRILKGEEILRGQEYWYFSDKGWSFENKEYRTIALDYLGETSVESFESQVKWEKEDNARNRKAERIDNLMQEVPVLPNDLEEWLSNEIFSTQYLFVKEDENNSKYECTSCGTKSCTKKKYKHNKKEKCPRCGENVTVDKRISVKFARENIIVLQNVGEKQWVERQLRAECEWRANKKIISVYENIRAIIDNGDHWGRVYYGTHNEANEFEQEYWDKNGRNQRFMKSYLYPNNLNELFEKGNLQHSGIDILASKKIKFNVNKMIISQEKKYLEYFIKSGLTKLACEITDQYCWYGSPACINPNGNKLKDVLGLDGQRTNRFKSVNGTLATLKWLKYEAENGIKITQESLQWLGDKNMSIGECEEIFRELKSVNKMVNYMKKQKISPKNIAQVWRDYLAMAEEEGMDLRDSIVRTPKNLKLRHDQLVEIRNERTNEEKIEESKKKNKKLNQKIKKNLPMVKKFFYEDEKYMIIPAGTCEELIREGQKLHHCVGASGTYMKRMAEGEYWILFLRKKEALEKSYYTIEINVKTCEIKQWHSEFNRQPNYAEIKKVLDKMVKQAKEKEKSKQITAA